MTRRSAWPKSLTIQKTSLGIPRVLYEAAKIQAMKQGRTLQELVTDAVDNYLKQLKRGGRDGEKR
jgi:hypothetical protein